MIPSKLMPCLMLPALLTAQQAAHSQLLLAAPLELARRISADPGCTQRVVLGPCFCGPTPCGVRVFMYVPLAFAETVRAPGDSVLLPSSPWPDAADGTISSSQSTRDNTSEAHVWAIGDLAWTLSTPLACMQCKPSDARAAPPPPVGAVDPACDAASSVVQGLAGLGATGLPFPSLAYASEADAVNWRTGCRDLPVMETWPTQAVGTLGAWGSLYPRQMRDRGTVPPTSSAKTAYRAMSIAREQLGTLSFPVEPDGLMQQGFPSVSACFRVGAQISPRQGNGRSGPSVSADGRYGWIYWRPVTCCIGYESAARCAAGSTVPPGPPTH